jgi:hypothetical protein
VKPDLVPTTERGQPIRSTLPISARQLAGGDGHVNLSSFLNGPWCLPRVRLCPQALAAAGGCAMWHGGPCRAGPAVLGGGFYRGGNWEPGTGWARLAVGAWLV